jgi:hypothetical protein
MKMVMRGRLCWREGISILRRLLVLDVLSRHGTTRTGFQD